MPNSATATVTADGGPPLDINARQARVESRVDALDSTVHQFQTNVGKAFDAVNLKIDAGHAEIGNALVRNSERAETAIKDLSTALNAKGQTNWGLVAAAIGVLLSIVTYVGSLALAPVTNALLDHKGSISEIQHAMVPREELRLHWEQDDRRYDDLRHTQQRTWDQIDKERDRDAAREEKVTERIEKARAEAGEAVSKLRAEVTDALRSARK